MDINSLEKFKDVMSLSERVLLDGKPLAVVYGANGSYAYLGNSKINFSKNAHNILLEKIGVFNSDHKERLISSHYIQD